MVGLDEGVESFIIRSPVEFLKYVAGEMEWGIGMIGIEMKGGGESGDVFE